MLVACFESQDNKADYPWQRLTLHKDQHNCWIKGVATILPVHIAHTSSCTCESFVWPVLSASHSDCTIDYNPLKATTSSFSW
jgi:hypothetical protein